MMQLNSLTVEERQDLVESHEWMVYTYAPRYLRKRLLKADMFQAAWLGLCIAARHFDPDAGLKFQTYAMYWLRNRCIAEQRAGLIAVKDYARYRGDPALRERVEKCSHVLSLDARCFTDWGESFDPAAPPPADDRREEKEQIWAAVDKLPPRMATVARQRFRDGLSRSEVATLTGVTRESVRQLEERAHHYLRRTVGGGC
jgi:RNA polymerase sigma factor (sigma-70 family)